MGVLPESPQQYIPPSLLVSSVQQPCEVERGGDRRERLDPGQLEEVQPGLPQPWCSPDEHTGSPDPAFLLLALEQAAQP